MACSLAVVVMLRRGEQIRAIERSVAGVEATLNNGLRAMVTETRAETAAIRAEVARIKEIVAEHTAREEIVFTSLAKAVTVVLSAVGTLVMLLLSALGFLLTKVGTFG